MAKWKWLLRKTCIEDIIAGNGANGNIGSPWCVPSFSSIIENHHFGIWFMEATDKGKMRSECVQYKEQMWGYR